MALSEAEMESIVRPVTDEEVSSLQRLSIARARSQGRTGSGAFSRLTRS